MVWTLTWTLRIAEKAGEFGGWGLEGDRRQETGDRRLETGDWRLETGDWRLETACQPDGGEVRAGNSKITGE